jgi:hypothetical protein
MKTEYLHQKKSIHNLNIFCLVCYFAFCRRYRDISGRKYFTDTLVQHTAEKNGKDNLTLLDLFERFDTESKIICLNISGESRILQMVALFNQNKRN